MKPTRNLYDIAHRYSEEVQTPSPYVPHPYVHPDITGVKTSRSPSEVNIGADAYVWGDFEKLAYLAHTHMNPQYAFLTHIASKTPGFVLSKYRIISYNKLIYYRQLVPHDLDIDEFEATSYWRRLMKDTGVKLIFIDLSVTLSGSTSAGGHANLIIIDKVRKVVEFFDPHGHHHVEYVPTTWSTDFAYIFKSKFQCTSSLVSSCFIPRKYTILRYMDSCPQYGFQYYDDVFGGTRDKYDRGGYCMLWCMFLLELRLANKHMSTKDVQEQFISTYGQSQTKEMLGKLFRKFIRRYNLFLYEIIPNRWYETSQMEI